MTTAALNGTRSTTLPARCHHCGRASNPRLAGTTPPGWGKAVHPVTCRVTYRCPNCLRDAR